MTDDQPVSAAPVVKVAQDLTAIADLCERLLTQAVHTANDRELPGGDTSHSGTLGGALRKCSGRGFASC